MEHDNKLYFVPHGSCYLQIIRVRGSGPDYIIANVLWFTKPGRKFIGEEGMLKIPTEAMKTWQSISLS